MDTGMNRQDAKDAKHMFSENLLGDLGVLAVQWFFAVAPILTDRCISTPHSALSLQNP
jgi:hypothetical protein